MKIFRLVTKLICKDLYRIQRLSFSSFDLSGEFEKYDKNKIDKSKLNYQSKDKFNNKGQEVFKEEKLDSIIKSRIDEKKKKKIQEIHQDEEFNANGYNKRKKSFKIEGAINNSNKRNNQGKENQFDFRYLRPNNYDKPVASSLGLLEAKEEEAIVLNNNTQESINKEIIINEKKHVKSEKHNFQKSENEINPNLIYSKYEHLYGYEGIKASLLFNKRTNLELFVNKNFQDEAPKNILEIIKMAQNDNISISYVSKDKLDRLSTGKQNNGLVLKTTKREYKNLKTFEFLINQVNSRDKLNLIIVFDQIVDSSEYASLLRSSYFIGCDKIITNKKGQISLSPTVSKISSGVSECIDIYCETNIKKFLKEAVKNNYTIINPINSDNKEQNNDIKEPNNKDDKEENNANEENIYNKIKTKTIPISQLELNKDEKIIILFNVESEHKIEKDTLIPYSKYISYKTYLETKDNKLTPNISLGVNGGIMINKIRNLI